MKKATIGVLILILLVLAAIPFFALDKLAQKKPSESLAEVTVQFGWLHNPQFVGFYVAKEKGFYRDAGLAVAFKEYEEGVNQIDDLLTGVIDFGVSTPVEILPAVQEGKKIKAVGVIYQTGPWALATLKSSNIKSPADFKGKRLGAKGDNSEAKIKYPALMNKFGIKASEATILGLDYTLDEADDLTTGRADVIDLYRTDQPYLLKKKGLEFNLLLPENFGVTGYGDTLITSDSLISTHPELVKEFVKATMKGWEYAADHPEEALAITLRYANKDYKDEERDKFILEQSLPLIKPTGDSPLGDMSFIIWNETAKNMEAAGVLKSHIDVTQAYTTEFIR
jgi:NitT/TauT family transport system substrate-binding protein